MNRERRAEGEGVAEGESAAEGSRPVEAVRVREGRARAHPDQVAHEEPLEIQVDGAPLAVVESVKAASDIYSPVDGFVSEVNGELEGHPEFINQDPYGEGWIVRLTPDDSEQSLPLLDAPADRATLEAPPPPGTGG